jgi:ribosomal subunit interface protein
MKNGKKATGNPNGHEDRKEVRILLAEDNFEMRKLLAWSLSNQGYTVIECPDGACILRKLGIVGERQHEKFDLIVSDIRMPGVTGLEVLEGKRIFDELPPVILITAFPDKNTLAEANKLGAAAVFAKPFDVDDLLAHVRKLLPLIKKNAKVEEKQIRPKFPLDITYRRRKAIPAADDYIRERATKLNQFAEHIQHCRIIIDELHKENHKKHKYQVEIILDVPGKPIIGKYDSDEGEGEENLYYAIHISFAKIYRELKQLMEKQRNYRKDKFKVSEIIEED